MTDTQYYGDLWRPASQILGTALSKTADGSVLTLCVVGPRGSPGTLSVVNKFFFLLSYPNLMS